MVQTARNPGLLRTLILAAGCLTWQLSGHPGLALEPVGDPSNRVPPESTAPESTAPESTTPEGTAPESSPAEKPGVASLIDQLGAGDYSVREAAAERLLALGMTARSALMQGLKHPDLEIRMRAHQILVRTLQDDFERRMDAFVADVDDQHDHGLPAWNRFRNVLGGDPKVRKLYVEILRSEADLLDEYEKAPEKLPETLLQRVRHLQANSITNFNINSEQKISPAVVAAILFLSTDPQVKSNPVLHSTTYSLLNQLPVRQAIQGGTHSRTLKQLLHDWIVRTDDASQPYYGLMLALNYDLAPAGLELGRRYLTQNSTSPTVLQYAAIAVGRFGGKKDLDALAPHLENKTVCHTWSNPQLKKDLIRIEVRDIVLAMMIHLTGQDLRKFGYELLQENETTLFHIHTFGFLEDEQREAAVAKWNAWRKENPES